MKTLFGCVCTCVRVLNVRRNSASTTTKPSDSRANSSAACAIYAVARGYFANVASVNSASNISIGTAANAIAAGICPPNPPPTNVTAALADLNAAWVALEAATTVPVVPPAPTPTASP